jgi:hypothetical protein
MISTISTTISHTMAIEVRRTSFGALVVSVASQAQVRA